MLRLRIDGVIVVRSTVTSSRGAVLAEIRLAVASTSLIKSLRSRGLR